MKTLYFDCRNGVCSDMILSGLLGLGIDLDCEAKHDLEHLAGAEHHHDHDDDCHDHGAEHHHAHSHRSYTEICQIIEKAPISPNAKKLAGNIYRTIACAEAKVHKESLETVHFHEVGRPEAIVNIISIAVAIDAIGADDLVCSDIHDGQGTIECSHGTIPVPVPAVMAIRESEEAKKLGYVYETDQVETELVTPSGLGILVGLGARYGYYPEDDSVLARSVGHGTRDTGRGGMEITLLEDGDMEDEDEE